MYVFLPKLIPKYIMGFVAIINDILIFILFVTSIDKFYCRLGFNFTSLHLLNPFVSSKSLYIDVVGLVWIRGNITCK